MSARWQLSKCDWATVDLSSGAGSTCRTFGNFEFFLDGILSKRKVARDMAVSG